MPRRSRTTLLTTLAAATLLAVALSAGPAAAATTWRYPSTQCPDTGAKGLQACVDGAAAGDTIELGDEVIDEMVTISRSLTLRPSDPSIQPRLDAITVNDQLEPEVRVTLTGLRVQYLVQAFFKVGGRDTFTIRDLEVGRDQPGASGILIYAMNPVTATITRTYARTTSHQAASLQLVTLHATGTSRFTVVANELTQTGVKDGGSGVSLQAQGTSNADLRILSNVIHHVAADNAGGAGGINVYAAGTATVRTDIVGNTIASGNGLGIALIAAGEPGQSMVANVFNNIIAHVAGSGIYAYQAAPGGLALHNDWNDIFASGRDLFFVGAPGPHTLHKDPRFRDLADGDLRLKPTSPLIDAGRACTVGGLSSIDAAGRFRWAGREVDMGAFERGAGAAAGVVRVGTAGGNTLVGTPGRDVLCGLGGNDRLTGRGGPDLVGGGPGKDVLCLRDGNGGDRGDGGPGTDRAQRDPGDTLTAVEGSVSC